MGSVCGGSSSGQTTTNSSSPPPQTLANYEAGVNRATAVANTPFTPYPGEQVAPLSNQTVTGLSNLDKYAYAAQPYLDQAGNMIQTGAGMTQGAAAPVTPDQFSGAAVGRFMDPFTQSVINATQNQFNNQNTQQAQFLNSQNMGAGAFGGDRAGLSQAVLAGQQQTSQAPVIAGLNQANYNQALAEFNNQQQTGLGAQEFNRQQMGQMGAQIGNLGTSYGNVGVGKQSAGISGAGAQVQGGMVPQAEQQAVDTSLQNTWNEGQAYPFQTTGWLNNTIQGLGSQTGGTGSTTTPGPSPISQGIGAATAAAGIVGDVLPFLPFSDIRTKENVVPVGKTFDGQTIHRFNYKGDPRTQIGLVAQEVERHHPEAVHQGLGGLKQLDYEAATSGSERPGREDGGPTGPTPGIQGTVGTMGLGKFSPQGALQMMGVGEPGTYAGGMGENDLLYTPAGHLFQGGQRGPSIPDGGPSPSNPIPANWQHPASPYHARAPGEALASGGRIDRADGGGLGYGNVQMSGIPVTPYIDYSGPVAIAQGTGIPSPEAGIANIEFSSAEQSQNGNNIPSQTLWKSSLAPSKPNLSGAAPGTVFKPIDYQDPSANFQTAGAERSLGPHWFTTGANGENVYGGEGAAPASTPGAINQGPALARPGGNLPTDTPKTENPPPPPPAAPAPAAPKAPAAAPYSPYATAHPVDQYAALRGAGLSNNNSRSAGPGAGASGGAGTGGRWDGGRTSFQGGGGLGDVSYYTPMTGNARGAQYHPAAPPPPLPPVRTHPTYRPIHVAPRAHPAPRVRAQAPPLPPPRPVDPAPTASPMPLPGLDQFPPPPPNRQFTAPRSVTDPMAGDTGASQPSLFHSLLPAMGGPRGATSLYPSDPDPDRARGLDELKAAMPGDRPSFNNSGGVMGQWPLAGATGYTPQGQGLTGFDSQGSGMGAGSVAKSAGGGFGDMFGDGLRTGGRIGFEDGGGLNFTDPALESLLKPKPFNLLEGIQPMPIGKGPPQPTEAGKGQAPADMGKGISDLGGSLTKLAGSLNGGVTPADFAGGMDFSDIGGVPDLTDDTFTGLTDANMGFGLGGIVRPRRSLWGGGDGGDGDGNATGGIGSDAAAGQGGTDAMGNSVGMNSPGGGSSSGQGVGQGGIGGVGYGGTTGHGSSGPSSGGVGGVGAGGVGGGTAGGVGGAPGGVGGSTGGNAGGTSGGGHGGGPGTSMSANAQTMMAILTNMVKNGVISAAQANEIAPPHPGTSPFGPGMPGTVAYGQNTTPRSGTVGNFGSGLGFGLGPGGQGDPSAVASNTAQSLMHGTPSGPAAPGVAGFNASPTGAEGVNTAAIAQAIAAMRGGQGIGSDAVAGGPGTTGHAPGTTVANPGTSPGLGHVAGVNAPGHVAGTTSPGLGHVAAPAPGVAHSLAPAATQSAGGMGGGSYASLYSPGHGGHALGGIVRSGFADGGPGPPDPPQPPEEEVAAPVPEPAPAAAAIAEAAPPAGAPTGGKPTREQVLEYNRMRAPKYGNNPDVVTRMLGGEMGGKDPYQVGDAGSSFGPWQLHKGGINPAMSGSGMGDEYTQATGHDPNDPRYWQEQSDFAQKKMSERGLQPWQTTMNKLGYNRWSARGDGDGGGALAFDGGGGKPSPQAGFSAAMDDAERTPDRKLLPPGLGDTLIMTGAAMMAGTSPNAMTNIGQGLMQGMKYYQQQRNLDQEWKKNDAQIQNWQADARYKDAQTKLEARQLNIGMAKIRLGYKFAGMPLPAEFGGDGDSASGATPAAGAASTAAPAALPPPTAATAPGAPAAAGSKPIPITPGALVAPGKTAGASPAAAAAPGPATGEKAPAPPPAPPPPPNASSEFQKAYQELDRKYNEAFGLEIADVVKPGTAVGIRQQMIEAIKTGHIATADGRVIIDPNLQAQESAGAARTKYEGELAESTGKAVAAIPAKMEARATVDQRLGEIQEMMQGFTTGAWAEEKAGLAAKAASIFGRDFVPEKWMKDAETFQRMTKDQILNTMDAVKAMGGRPMVTEIESLKRAMAGPEMQPGAVAAIVAQARGGLHWLDAHDRAFIDWANSHPGEYNTANFEIEYLDKHHLKDAIAEARHNFPYQGQTIPPPAQREAGQAYMTPKGARVWTGTGWGAFAPAQ